MTKRDHTCFGYRVSPEGDGWNWTTFDLAGRVQATGRAPSKAVAAACVIRALARSVAPQAPVSDAA